MAHDRLPLHRELLLIGLHDEKGSATAFTLELTIAAGALSELLISGRLELVGDKQDRVRLTDPWEHGDPVLDIAIRLIGDSKKERGLGDWVARLGSTAGLRDTTAAPLVEMGVLEASAKKVLGMFTITRYPESNPGPEHEIIERLRRAIFTPVDVDDRTLLLLTVANLGHLLPPVFGRTELKRAKDRLKQLTAVPGRGTSSPTPSAAIRDAIARGLHAAIAAQGM